MKKIAIILMAVLCLILLLSTLPYAKEPAKKSPIKEETVPLVSEVMTKEELQAYLKEKGIPIITKGNFREPELEWERTFENEFIASIGMISDITEKGNSIIISGRIDPTADKKLLFLDSKGNTRKEVPLGKTEMNALVVAKGGMAAAAGKWNDKNKTLSLSYYDEEGNKLWSKEIKLKAFGKVAISDNGEAIAIEEGNPNWSIEEWGGALNISKVIFLDSKGKQVFEYTGFRNIGWGEFSADGNYYAGLFWWQDDTKTWGKLININVREGKILWERPFGGNYWRTGETFGDDNYLAISEKGTYVLVVDIEPAEKMPKGHDARNYFEVKVFNRTGSLILRTKGGSVDWINERGLLEFGEMRGISLASIFESKIIKNMSITNLSYSGNHFLMHTAKWEESKHYKHHLFTILQEMLWEKEIPMVGAVHFTLDGNYLKAFGGEKNKRKVLFYRLSN